MRAALFRAIRIHPSQRDWEDFLRRSGRLTIPPQAQELAQGVWFLPLPDCQNFLAELSGVVRQMLPSISARTLEVDFQPPWQTVS